MLVIVILVCEVAFWVLLIGGLTARYVLRRPGLGGALLVAAPMVDLVTLTAAVLDLRHGGTASGAHVLAAIYLGVSVGFGHRIVRWADVRFAHRYAGGPAPEPKPKHGMARARFERELWLRHLLAWAVGTGLMGTAIIAVGDPERTAAFVNGALLWTVILLIDFLVSFSYTLWPRRDRSPRADSAALDGDELPAGSTTSMTDRPDAARAHAAGKVDARVR